MTSQIQLRMKTLPKALGELAHSNQFLKMSAFGAYLLCGLLIGLLFFCTNRTIPVLTLAPDGSSYQLTPMPKPEVEIERAIREYLKFRYNWEPKTIANNVSKAEAFILPGTRKAYSSAMESVVRFSAEKLVVQRVYPERILIDLKKNVATIRGDRITEIQGMKAAGDLRLQLSLDFGARTVANPWGVYVAKETEGQ